MYTGRVTLASLGIHEVETNVCEDTAENRRILRENTVPYHPAEPGFLEVDILAADKEAKTRSMLERNKLILEDPRDPWSDYISFDELPLDFMETAPVWMQRHLNKYNDAVAAGVPEHKLPYLPNRCRRRRSDGSRCWSWAWSSAAAEGYCRFHAPPGSFDYGAQFQKLTEAAKARLVEMQGSALDALEELVNDRETVPHVRLKAAEGILDRTGLSPKQDVSISAHVEHELKDPAAAVRERLQVLAERLHQPAELLTPEPAASEPIIVDAEVVEESE